jgi:predicted peptidase
MSVTLPDWEGAMKVLLVLALILLVTAAMVSSAPVIPKNLSNQLEKKAFTGAKGEALLYRLMQPEPCGKERLYPLVVFLHGAGERGKDNETQLLHGVGEFARLDNRRKYPCFLAAPQCPTEKKWVEVDWSAPHHVMPDSPGDVGLLVLELVESLAKELPIDQKRIYLTGLSMGGYGTWDQLMRRPDLFAAGVPICGGADEKQAVRIAKIPIWVFHGTLDGAVPVSRSRNMVAALENAGGHPLYTEYPDEGHASWVPAYRSPAMMNWLFAQKKGK